MLYPLQTRPRLTVLAATLLAALHAGAQTPSTPTATSAAPSNTPGAGQRVEINGSLGTQRPGALRNDIVQTESFGERAIERSGATNINEALDKNPGIAV